MAESLPSLLLRGARLSVPAGRLAALSPEHPAVAAPGQECRVELDDVRSVAAGRNHGEELMPRVGLRIPCLPRGCLMARASPGGVVGAGPPLF
jgi:hypothetical protein